MKKKILFVVDERMMGGVSVVLNDLIHLLDLSRYEIDVLALHDHGDMLNDLPSGVNLIFGSSYFCGVDYTLKQALLSKSFQVIWSKIRIVLGLKSGTIKHAIKKQRKKCLDHDYDVEVAFKDGFTALFTAYGNTPKKIHWLHCAYKTFNPNEKYEALFKETLVMFDRIVGVTPAVIREFNEKYHLDKLTEAIPIAMDVERIKKLSSMDSQVKLNPDKFQVVAIGRAHPVKGYDRMIKVMDRLYQEKHLEDVEVHIFGDGPLWEELKQQIQTSHLENTVFLEGQVKNPYAELKQYDLLILPSYSEAFGTVMSEAFILGVPVLTTHTSASELSLKPNLNGWECENSEEGLYLGFKKVVMNRKEVSSIKTKLESFTYDNDKILKRINALLSE